MRSPLNILLLSLLLLGCDQAPTTLEEEPYRAPIAGTDFTMDIVSFDFDYLSREFFFSVAIENPPDAEVFDATLITTGLAPITLAPLNDAGTGGDIQVNDGLYDGGWTLPEAMLSYVDSQWTLSVTTTPSQLSTTRSIQPQRPVAPAIQSVTHEDTLTLSPNGFVVDTLRVVVSHSQGLDEIRDVSMMSLKPDGEYANGGQAIPLYDDGGSEIFFSFNNVDYTSGDSLAGDGIYALLLILSPSNLSGTYHWTFSARTWLGISSEPFVDSVLVLPPANLTRPTFNSSAASGVFQ